MKKNYPLAGGLPAKIRTLSLLLCLAAFQLNAQIELVKDLVTSTSSASEFSLVYEAGDILYFTSENDLWVSDTEGNPTKLKDFKSIGALTHLGNDLVFFADDGIVGAELWKSDGTVEGTTLVKDIFPGSSTGGWSEFVHANGKIFFVANNGVSGREVWSTDGTPSGTFMVKDIMKGVGHSNASFLTAFNGHVYFAANDAIHGYELWRTDGTSTGTTLVVDIWPGKNSSAPQHIVAHDGHLYFSARSEAEGEEFWISDGTAAGTSLLLDINPGGGSSYPKNILGTDGTIYFTAHDGSHGVEFWASDGTTAGTSMITDLNPGIYNGVQWLEAMAGHNGLLYFVVGWRLFVSDGTEAGTTYIQDIGDFYSRLSFAEYEGGLYVIDFPWDHITQSTSIILRQVEDTTVTDVKILGYGSSGLYPINGTSSMYFIAPDMTLDSHIWKSDGTEEGTIPFVNLGTYTYEANPENFIHFNGKVYINTNVISADSVEGNGLWSTDGTEAGTELIVPGNVLYLVAGEELLFFFKDGALWKSDGTPEGSSSVKSLLPRPIGTVGDIAYFSASIGGAGDELWKSDGTPEGTVMVKDIYPGGSLSSSPRSFTNVNGILFFSARTSVGEELWKSDGTDAGTVLVKDIMPGSAGSEPMYLTAFDNQLFFVARRPAGGLALYGSDGTNAGTVIVKEFPSDPVINFNAITISGGRLYFVVRHTSSSLSLYQTDGTAAGTSHVQTFPDALGVEVLLAYHGKTHLLVRYSPNYQTELWATDGTETGTSVIAELEDTSLGNSSVILDDVLYFEGTSWLGRTDGTSCGTFFIRDDSDFNVRMPSNLTQINDKIIFSAYTNQYGSELFKLEASNAPTADCEETLALALREAEDLSEDENDKKSSFGTYPNPFFTDFQLTFNKERGERFDVIIYGMDGQVKARYNGLNADEKYALGEKLERGLYFIRITSNGRSETRRLIKQ